MRTELTSGAIAGSGTPNVRAVQSTPDKVGTKVGGLSVGNEGFLLEDVFEGVIVVKYGVELIDDSLKGFELRAVGHHEGGSVLAVTWSVL